MYKRQIDTLYGGGTFIGGIQITGESIAGEPIKTPIPVPLDEPMIQIKYNTESLKISKLNTSTTYELQKSNQLLDEWSTLEIIESPEKNEIIINDILLNDSAFYRVYYPLKALKMSLSE